MALACLACTAAPLDDAALAVAQAAIQQRVHVTATRLVQNLEHSPLANSGQVSSMRIVFTRWISRLASINSQIANVSSSPLIQLLVELAGTEVRTAPSACAAPCHSGLAELGKRSCAHCVATRGRRCAGQTGAVPAGHPPSGARRACRSALVRRPTHASESSAQLASLGVIDLITAVTSESPDTLLKSLAVIILRCAAPEADRQSSHPAPCSAVESSSGVSLLFEKYPDGMQRMTQILGDPLSAALCLQPENRQRSCHLAIALLLLSQLPRNVSPCALRMLRPTSVSMASVRWCSSPAWTSAPVLRRTTVCSWCRAPMRTHIWRALWSLKILPCVARPWYGRALPVNRAAASPVLTVLVCTGRVDALHDVAAQRAEHRQGGPRRWRL